MGLTVEQYRVEFDEALGAVCVKAERAHLIAMLDGLPQPRPSLLLREAVRVILTECEWRRIAAINYARAMS